MNGRRLHYQLEGPRLGENAPTRSRKLQVVHTAELASPSLRHRERLLILPCDLVVRHDVWGAQTVVVKKWTTADGVFFARLESNLKFRGEQLFLCHVRQVVVALRSYHQTYPFLYFLVRCETTCHCSYLLALFPFSWCRCIRDRSCGRTDLHQLSTLHRV